MLLMMVIMMMILIQAMLLGVGARYTVGRVTPRSTLTLYNCVPRIDDTAVAPASQGRRLFGRLSSTMRRWKYETL